MIKNRKYEKKYVAFIDILGFKSLVNESLENIETYNNIIKSLKVFTNEKIAQEKPEEIGRECPDCGKPLLKRKSRYGNYFIGCSGYPKCKYVESIEGEAKPKRARKKK